MKNRYLLLAAAALLIMPSANALAADEADVSGSLEVGVRGVNDADNSAKFLEYRDLNDGIYGNIFLDYFKSSYFFNIEGENIGQDDQSYLFKGGSYGNFKYSLFYDEIPHNLSFDAKTFYSGVGGDTLIIGGDPANIATWRNFDYTVDRKKYGADVEVSLGSLFFIDIGVNRQEKDGLKPMGTGEFSGQIEVPEPVDYTTDNLTITGGYRSTDIMFKVAGMLSSFDNDKKFLMWTNPFSGDNEVDTLPPDNDYGKINANFTWRQLPMMSTLLVNASYSNLSNDFSIFELHVPIPAALNTTDFEGDISYTTFGVSFASRPIDQLRTRLYYNFLDKTNDSTVITYIDDSNESDLFEYTKNNAGVDVDYDLGMQTLLSGGYEFENIDRTNRPDVESNTDNNLYIKVKNSSLDYLTAKFEYAYLNRDSDSDFDLTGVTMTDAEWIEQYVNRFDHTTKTKNSVKVGIEVYPTDDLDLGIDYTYAINDYDDVTLGRTKDRGHELYFDVMWRAAKMLNLSGFAGYEKYKADSNHYNYSVNQSADPLIDDGNPATYRWNQTLDDDFWTVGLMAEIPLMQERLKLSLSGQYQNSDGQTDFGTQGLNPLLSINDADDYDLTTIEAKALYALTENLDLTLGYMYEKMNYDDLQYEGYNYHPNGSYLTGAYLDHDYEAHVGYFIVKYNF